MRNFLRVAILVLFVLFVPFSEALVVNSLTYNGKFDPGEMRRIEVTVTNEKDEVEQVELKLVDYWTNAEGQHFFEQSKDQQRSNVPWVKLGVNRVTLQPKESATIHYTVNVPNDPNLKGSYWSVIIFEPADPIATKERKENEFQLLVKVRYAYHIVTDIDQGESNLKILQKDFKNFNGKELLCIDVANVGEVFLNPQMTLKLYSEAGILEKTLDGRKERLYPGSSSRYFIDPDGVEKKNYKVFMLLDNADGNMFGEAFDLRFP